MTDLTTPGEVDAAIDTKTMSHSVGKAGGHDGYIVNGVDLASNFTALDDTGINGFAHVSDLGLDITFDGGEAFVWGWLARDTQTTVSLPASSTVTVGVGFDLSATLASGESPADSANVLLGTDSEFAAVDPHIPIYEITTNGDSVTGVTDLRPLGRADAIAPPWAQTDPYDHPSTLPGRMTFESDTFREHLRLDRPGVAYWDITPTTRQGGGLLFSRDNDTTEFEMQDDGELSTGDGAEYFTKSDGEMRLVISSSEPADYDVWFEVS